VKFAVGLPNIGEYADPRVVMDLARRTEEHGWDGFFLWDHLLYGSDPLTDPQVAMAAAATVTTRIRLGVLIVQFGRRRPGKVAREMVALDQLSSGRMVFGVGLGANARDFDAFGDDPDPKVRGRKTDEGLDVITGLWSGEPFTYTGEHFAVNDVTFTPVPVQRPRIPIWVAGTWPARPAFRRAARFDGVFPTFRDTPLDENVQPGELAEAVAYTHQHRTADLPSLEVVLEGATPGAPPLEAYKQAGLTWWVEKLGWWRGNLDHTIGRIADGPPS
jgi:alkanesulfonate monooxygenase SsuD/methylene tetrahydromethanopterin reductase-like flavin-dependent oxidoreductase (luciferase family)